MLRRFIAAHLRPLIAPSVELMALATVLNQCPRCQRCGFKFATRTIQTPPEHIFIRVHVCDASSCENAVKTETLGYDREKKLRLEDFKIETLAHAPRARRFEALLGTP